MSSVHPWVSFGRGEGHLEKALREVVDIYQQWSLTLVSLLERVGYLFALEAKLWIAEGAEGVSPNENTRRELRPVRKRTRTNVAHSGLRASWRTYLPTCDVVATTVPVQCPVRMMGVCDA